MIPNVAESGKEATGAVPVRVTAQGIMQLTLAPVPAFSRSFSTSNDLDQTQTPIIRRPPAESGANHCWFEITAISGEYSMAPTKAGLPELQPEPNQGSGGEQATSYGSVARTPLELPKQNNSETI